MPTPLLRCHVGSPPGNAEVEPTRGFLAHSGVASGVVRATTATTARRLGLRVTGETADVAGRLGDGRSSEVRLEQGGRVVRRRARGAVASVGGEALELFADDRLRELRHDLPHDALDDLAGEGDDRLGLG